MSEALIQQRKQEVLMRVARSRVETFEAVAQVQTGSSACLSAVGGARGLGRGVLAFCASGVGLMLVRKLMRRKGVAPVEAPRKTAAPRGGWLRRMALQTLTLVVVPWLRSRVAQVTTKSRAGYWQPSRIFMRIVGLEK